MTVKLPALTRYFTSWFSIHYINMKHNTDIIEAFLHSEKYARQFIKNGF